MFTGRVCLIYTKEELQAYQIETRLNKFVEYVQVEIIGTLGIKLLITCIYSLV